MSPIQEKIDIIAPCHNRPAKKCPSWRAIKEEAELLRELVSTGEFRGNYKQAFAISHAQVAPRTFDDVTKVDDYTGSQPFNFFVVNETIDNGWLKKQFGHWCIMNARIVKFGDPVSIKDACMSFPFRTPRNTDRMNKITAKYRVPFFFWSRPVTRKLEGLPAFIVQHEVEHAAGGNIHGLK